MKLFLLTAALILSTSVYAQDAAKPPTGGIKAATRMKPKAPVGCTLVGTVRGTKLWAVTVRRQIGLEAAFRQPKAANHLCRMKPLERSRPARNDLFVSEPSQKTPADAYVGHMFKAFEFCIPTKSTIVPHGQDWLHEVSTTARRVIQKRPSVPGAHSCSA